MSGDYAMSLNELAAFLDDIARVEASGASFSDASLTAVDKLKRQLLTYRQLKERAEAVAEDSPQRAMDVVDDPAAAAEQGVAWLVLMKNRTLPETEHHRATCVYFACLKTLITQRLIQMRDVDDVGCVLYAGIRAAILLGLDGRRPATDS